MMVFTSMMQINNAILYYFIDFTDLITLQT
jgi:hypothetical protein